MIFIEDSINIIRKMPTQLSFDIVNKSAASTAKTTARNPLYDLPIVDLIAYVLIAILAFLIGYKVLKWYFARKDQEEPEFYETNRAEVIEMCRKHVDTRYYLYKKWDILKQFPKGVPIDLKDPRTGSTVWLGNYVGHCYTQHDGCLNILYASSRLFHLGRWFPVMGVIKIRDSKLQLSGTETRSNKKEPSQIEVPASPFFWGEYSIDIFCAGLEEYAGFEYPILIDDKGNIIDQSLLIANDWAKLADKFQKRDWFSGSVRSMYHAVRMNPEGQLKKKYGGQGMSIESGEIPSA